TVRAEHEHGAPQEQPARHPLERLSVETCAPEDHDRPCSLHDSALAARGASLTPQVRSRLPVPGWFGAGARPARRAPMVTAPVPELSSCRGGPCLVPLLAVPLCLGLALQAPKIEGVVRGLDGAPASGARVVLSGALEVSSPTTHVFEQATTGADGRFAFAWPDEWRSVTGWHTLELWAWSAESGLCAL